MASPRTKNNNNNNGHHRQVNFVDNLNDFAEAVANQGEEVEDEEQDEPFQQGKFLLDSAAYPSHVYSPELKANFLPSPLRLNTKRRI